MPARQAICIVVDGLRASALGCYGNAWAPTPAFDELASRSCVADWCYCDSPALDGFYHSVWHGRPSWSTSPNDVERTAALPQVLDEIGVELCCVTDEPRLTSVSTEFSRFATQLVEMPGRRASSPSGTAACRLFEAAASHLVQPVGAAERTAANSTTTPRLLWIHARGMHGAWDAPMEARAVLHDEEDPPPSDLLTPPARIQVTDPDEALIFRSAYAAQVAMFDLAVEGFCSVLADSPTVHDTLVLLAGARGFALGEHGMVGGDWDELYSEMLHVPLLATIYGAAAGSRVARLLQPFDLRQLIVQWFENGVLGKSTIAPSDYSDDSLLASFSGRDVALARNERAAKAIRTPAWHLIDRPADRYEQTEISRGEAEPASELFVKPDDRWEANEIGSLRSEIVERLGMLASAATSWPDDGGEMAEAFDDDLTKPES